MIITKRRAADFFLPNTSRYALAKWQRYTCTHGANTAETNFNVARNGPNFNAHEMFDEMPHGGMAKLNRLLSGYLRNGHAKEARGLFGSMVDRDVVSWTIMIGMVSREGRLKEALGLFREMQYAGVVPDFVTVVEVLRVCTDPSASVCALQIHSWIVKSGFGCSIAVSNALISAYCKCGRIELACAVFEEMETRNSITFNLLMAGYLKEGSYVNVLALLLHMRKSGLRPTQFTFSNVLNSATGLTDLGIGTQIHGQVVKSNFTWEVHVNNSLLDFYSKMGCLNHTRKLFDEMLEKNIVTYNVMISSYSRHSLIQEAFELFRELQLLGFDHGDYPYPCLLSIAGSHSKHEIGRQIHGQVVQHGMASSKIITTALINMYSQCGNMSCAELIFAQNSGKTTTGWTALITGHVQNGFHEEALKLFVEMRKTGPEPDMLTFSSVLKACSSLTVMSLGEQMHSCLLKYGYLSSVFAGSALVDMYAKCGLLEDAKNIFDEKTDRNVVSWNALISAYAQNGEGRKAIETFERMVKSGFKPEPVSFLGLLIACSHSGLVEEGLLYFDSMTRVYNLTPGKEHYGCMFNMLGRVGRFDKVKQLLGQIPFEPDPAIWNSILNSSKIHGNYQLGKLAAGKLISAETKDASRCVLMSNIYAKHGDWTEVARIKDLMRENGVRKVPGYSWVKTNRHE